MAKQSVSESALCGKMLVVCEPRNLNIIYLSGFFGGGAVVRKIAPVWTLLPHCAFFFQLPPVSEQICFTCPEAGQGSPHAIVRPSCKGCQKRAPCVVSL